MIHLLCVLNFKRAGSVTLVISQKEDGFTLLVGQLNYKPEVFVGIALVSPGKPNDLGPDQWLKLLKVEISGHGLLRILNVLQFQAFVQNLVDE